MKPFTYRCPFCGQAVTITDSNYSEGEFNFSDQNRHGLQLVCPLAITCPNPECGEYSLRAALYEAYYAPGGVRKKGKAKREWQLVPQSSAKVLPSYIPSQIVNDYNEACAIKSLSPKASATLARRCLQGMIRDFWGISKSRLVDEIDALQTKVDPLTWSAIDGLRKIGNIGAHMGRDIGVIVDVEPDEAELLISLIETLVHDWYVVRYDREQRLKRLVQASLDKDQERKGERELEKMTKQLDQAEIAEEEEPPKPLEDTV